MFEHMSDRVVERNGVPVLVVDGAGAPIGGDDDVLDLIGSAFGRADTVAIPAERLDQRFFALRTGVAGEIMQKFVNYRLRLAIIGDISAHIEGSTALRDLVRESNRGNHVWFLDDLDGLDAKL
jgi:ABC-type amino acid transport substrate-binding protein